MNSVLLLNVPPDTHGLIAGSDRKTFSYWTASRNKIFQTNSLKDAKIIPLNGNNAKALLDSNYTTNWTTIGNDTIAMIGFSVTSPITFDVVLLQGNITVGCWV
jgi:alpha-L-fucosidase